MTLVHITDYPSLSAHLNRYLKCLQVIESAFDETRWAASYCKMSERVRTFLLVRRISAVIEQALLLIDTREVF